MKQSIARSDVGQESIAQALTFVGAFHQACYVHHIEESWHFAEKKHRCNTWILST